MSLATKTHFAKIPVGDIQECLWCGMDLSDYDNSVDRPDPFWPVGMVIQHGSKFRRWQAGDELSTPTFCAPSSWMQPEPPEPLADWEKEALSYKDEEHIPAPNSILYLSGPMRGYPDYNYPSFHKLAEYLRKWKVQVRNPAENYPNEKPGSRTYQEYMKLDLANVCDSTGIVLLPGWERSEGAKVEAFVARLLKHVFYEAYKNERDEWRVRPIETPSDLGGDGIEEKARALVFGDRNEDYGPPSHDFECIGRKWAATLSAHTGIRIEDIPATIVAVMMIDVKSSRLGNKPDHLDSRIDTIGYALCLDRIITGK